MSEFCCICGRVKWGNWVKLSGDKWRHDECAIGSEAWKEHYLGLRPAEQVPLADFFNFSYPEKEQAPCDKGGLDHETI